MRASVVADHASPTDDKGGDRDPEEAIQISADHAPTDEGGDRDPEPGHGVIDANAALNASGPRSEAEGTRTGFGHGVIDANAGLNASGPRSEAEGTRTGFGHEVIDANAALNTSGEPRSEAEGTRTVYRDPNLPDLASSLLWAHRKSSSGEAAVRIRTSEDQAAFYRAAREQWRRRGLPKNLLFALCLNFWLQWLSAVRASYTKWDPIHRRDGWTCANPMCDRQVCTLHHIVFQALGGDDRWENLITLCEKCHLEGIHGRESLLLFGEAPGALTFVTEQWGVRGRDKRATA